MTETTFENYQERAARTIARLGSNAADGAHMALGITTETEEFYKIGKTYRAIKDRFYTDTLLPYNYKIVKLFEGEARGMSEL